jgi:inositol hexakisphosphate/diphosphoinositol-pentakisphosphate kinase
MCCMSLNLVRRRVTITAETFGSALLDDPKDPVPKQHPLIIRKDLLDDSNAAKGPVSDA